MRLIGAIVCTLTTLGIGADARGGSADFDLSGSVGLPNVQITNPTGSTAAYDGLAVFTRLGKNLIDSSRFQTALTFNLRYLDLKNTNNSESQSEVSTHLGPGLGLRFEFAKFVLGADYNLMNASHKSSGTITNNMSYKYDLLYYYLGLQFPLGAGAIGVNYGFSNAMIPKDETGLSKDSKYQDSLIMVHLVWDLNLGVGKALANLAR